MSIRTHTQEDPIGLAGGLNLYGFAGGDPINFSDPFGLNPFPVEDPPPGIFTASGMLIGAALGGFGGGTGGLVMCAASGPGAAACAGAGGMAGSKAGAVIGGAIGAAIDAGIMWMSGSRDQAEAVERAEALMPSITGHMDLIRGDPDGQGTPHHAGEVRGWLERIQRLTKQMRGRTQRRWRDVIKTIRDELDEIGN